VIDPKAELLDFVIHTQQQIAEQRSIVNLTLSNHEHILHFFEGLGVTKMPASDVADRILSTSTYIEREMRSRDPFWGQSARRVIKAFLAIDHYLFCCGGIEMLTDFWEAVANQVSSAISQENSTTYNYKHKAFEDTYTRFNIAIEDVRVAAVRLLYRSKNPPAEVERIHTSINNFHAATTDYERGMKFDRLMDNCQSVATWCTAVLKGDVKLSDKKAEHYLQFLEAAKRAESIGETLMAWMPPREEDTTSYQVAIEGIGLTYDRQIYLRPLFTLLNLATTYHRESSQGDIVIEAYLKIMKRFQIDLSNEKTELQGLITLAPHTFSSVIAVVNGILSELSSPELAVHISLNPYEAPIPDKWLSVVEMMDQAAIVIYTPGENSSLSNLVGRCMKRMFFGYVFRRNNMVRPFVFVADEFQRFCTSDPESSEATFLEKSRAFRGICILATQSVASLRYALELQDSSANSEGRFALPMLLNNIGTNLYFRSTDPETQMRLMQMIPAPSRPDRPHVIQVRPVASLKVGECYYLFSNGKLGRGQIAL
jgi:hypothetical protein